MFKRPPDLIIGKKYLSRWYVIPHNRLFNIYLHKFESSDDDRALHDHPWYSMSILFSGEIKEHSFKRVRLIPWLWPVFRTAKFAHRLELMKGPVWTLFITGPVLRTWGFHCPENWRHWTEFSDESGQGIGKGCD